MGTSDREFLKHLRTTFRAEADEHIQSISDCLIGMEQSPDPATWTRLTEQVFRETHSLKGAARSVSLKLVESICRPLEAVFSALKLGSIVPTPARFDVLHRSIDLIARIISTPDLEGTIPDQEQAKEVVKDLDRAITGEASPEANDNDTVVLPPVAEMKLLEKSTVRLPLERLDELMHQAEELVALKMTARHQAMELNAICQDLQTWKHEASQRKASGASAMNMRDEGWHDRCESILDGFQDRMTTMTQASSQNRYQLDRLVDEHLENMRGALMLPAASLMQLFPVLVRDLARDQGKAVDLVIHGDDLACDKRVLDGLKDPLIHLIRNCVDHGMLAADKRCKQGKPPRGTITAAFTAIDSQRMELRVSDDGEGIDQAQVRSAAIKAGIFPKETIDALESGEAVKLIFQSGVSTSTMLTDISGRGLGLPIVHEKITALGAT